MTFENLLNLIPDYARDLRVNLSNVLRQTELSEQQLWGTVVASAMSSRNPQVIEALLPEASTHLKVEAFTAAKTAAAIMGMNNVYYRFLHLVGNEKYREIPARLRMQGIRTHGIEPLDFELWCTAASAINGCGACLDAHERVVREKGMTEEAVAAAVRIASVVHAVATVLETESVGFEQPSVV